MATTETNQQERTGAQGSDAQGAEEATGQQQGDARQGDGAGTQEIKDNFPVRKNDPRTSVQKNEEYRFASNIPGDQTMPEKAYADYTLAYDEDDAVMNGKIPDVLLDVPSLGVEELHLEVESLKARISVQAELADMVKLNVGVDVDLGKVKLGVKGLDAQVLLKVKLDNVRAILEQALEAIDRDPSILDRLTGETHRKDREPSEDGRPRDRVGTGDQAEQTVRRTVDESGNVRETMLDGSGNVLEESASGDLADLSLEEEYRDEEGRTIGRARDYAGNVVEEELDERGNVAGFIGFVGANEVGRREATEAAERKAREMGVDLAGVNGTGSGGAYSSGT